MFHYIAWVPYNLPRGVETGLEEQPKRGIVLKVLSEPVAVRLKEFINDVVREAGSEVLEDEVMPDHVHLLCEVDQQFDIVKFVRLVKGCTSHHLRREFDFLRSRLPTLWTNSWFVATVGGAPLATIKRYIQEQKNR
jgi:putative transposase